MQRRESRASDAPPTYGHDSVGEPEWLLDDSYVNFLQMPVRYSPARAFDPAD